MVIDVQKVKERKKLRLEILTQLYNLHYFAVTQNNNLHGKTSELFGERNSEKHLAYHYLLTAGYIEIESIEDNSAITLTAKGIDYVEDFYEKKE
ncbi:hypothetical protein [Metasolibacillus sp.]|uniref:hypothetical protein n=1 Tax=Metasolibacillus sp. TaxID=2703680 RepID=UPI0025CCBBC4|nr:hypothetical protein [Metasolibacillus sp.]MCT6925220.1 hypothetical protein [Metasolibacillus sp.]MCT6941422.1 hypothetical protein [Metasolibacillus sp.]